MPKIRKTKGSRVTRRVGTKTVRAQIAAREAYRAALNNRKDKTKGA